MKYLRKFDSVSDMNTALASATINILGLAYNGSTPVMRIKSGGSPVPPTPSYSTPFYVENITQQNETLTIAGYDWTDQDDYFEIQVEYSTDGTSWDTLGTTGETPLTRTLQPGDKVYLMATTDTWCEFQEEPYIDRGCCIFGVSKVGGNIMSLLYGSNFSGNETAFPSGSMMNFQYLFNDINDEYACNRKLVSASELILPATTLADYCYNSMFKGCTALTIAPVLPATTLTNNCYTSMFQVCTSLTTAPTLPATTLAQDCYNNMFQGCTSLTTAPALPATTLASNCYDCMFEGCESLTTAPALPATTLVDYCYSNMFADCTSLNEITIYADDISAEGCLDNWLYNVAESGTFNNMGSANYPSGASGNPWS